ncbi:hypothetical protein HK405_003333 [Cladochytrium tenue]|nr:hypothetical protein HK405_003333 [Cladochytrium tenue]
MTDLATEINDQSPGGSRGFYGTLTIRSDLAALEAVYEAFNASLATITDASGLLYSLALEPLPPAIYARHATENVMGLSNRTDTLVVVLLTALWSDASDDTRVFSAAETMFGSIQ